MHRGLRRDHDAKRDRWLNERGVKVIRITTRELSANMDGVLRAIKSVADQRCKADGDCVRH